MVSHAWSENAEEFLETALRSTSTTDVLFICAFAIYQCEDGHGPSIKDQLGTDPEESPFARVLQHISNIGNGGRCWKNRSYLMALPLAFAFLTLIMFLLPVIFYGDIPMPGDYVQLGGVILEYRMLLWGNLACAVAAVVLRLLLLPVYNGRMLVVPNRNDDIYTRLWCVYEVFVATAKGVPVHLARTLASMGSSSSREAKCWIQDDMDRIRGDIQSQHGEVGFDLIDKAVERTRRGAFISTALTMMKVGVPLVFLNVALLQIMLQITTTFAETHMEPIMSKLERVECNSYTEALGHDQGWCQDQIALATEILHSTLAFILFEQAASASIAFRIGWILSIMVTLFWVFTVCRSYEGRPCKHRLWNIVFKLFLSSGLLCMAFMAFMFGRITVENTLAKSCIMFSLGWMVGSLLQAVNLFVFLLRTCCCCCRWFFYINMLISVLWSLYMFCKVQFWSPRAEDIYPDLVRSLIFVGNAAYGYAMLFAMTQHWGIVIAETTPCPEETPQDAMNKNEEPREKSSCRNDCIAILGIALVICASVYGLSLYLAGKSS